MPESEILARVPWFRSAGLALALFPLAIVGSMARDPWSWGLLFWMALSLVMGYVALAGLLNHSRITLRDGILEIRPFPLPFKGVKIPLSEVTALEVHGNASTEGMDTMVNWVLRAQRRSGPPLKLCTGPKGGTDYHGAEAIRRTLCTRLGLPLEPG